MNVPAIIALVWATAANPCGETERSVHHSLDAAIIAPADATLFVHVEQAADLRKELADRPIAQWINALGHNGPGSQMRQAWAGLAKASRLNDGTLFDVCLGQRCSLIVRDGGQWALVTQVEEARATRLLQQLKVRICEPKFSFAISELPEQDMVLARRNDTLIIGPIKHSELFDEVLKRSSPKQAGALDHANDSLAQVFSASTFDSLKQAQGRIIVMVRHKNELGGHSVAVADLKGDRLTIKQAAHFDHPPFNRGVTKLTCDFSPVLLFENQSLLAMMQPTDVTDGPVETFVTAALGEGFISRQMRSNLGPRRLVIVNETEGRQLQNPVDLLSTTIVCGLQVKDREGAVEQLDAQMVRMTRRMNELGKGAFLVHCPDVHRLRPSEPRQVDMSCAGDWFTGGFPIMKNLSLSWTVADGATGTWFVIGSHRKSLDEVVETLQGQSGRNPLQNPGDAPSKAFRGQFDSCGSGNGLRIGRHLQSWSDQADQFAEPDKVDEFRSTLQMMSDLAHGMQTCRWQLARPTPNQVQLDVQIKLAPPESARAE